MSDQIELNSILDQQGVNDKQREIILELFSLLEDDKKADFIRYLKEDR